jgi:hypothetical protein
VLSLLLFLAALAPPLDDAARELTRRIVAAVGKEPVTLGVRNISSLSAAEAAGVRQAIAAGLRAGEGAAVAVTLSENVQGYVWIAEVVKNGGREAIVLPVARPAPPVATARMAISQRLLVSGREPILDVAAVPGALMSLEPGQVRIAGVALPIAHAKPWPRDVRGRLAVHDNEFQAWLPGVLCTGTVQPPAIACAASDAPWPVEPAGSKLAPGRNYFLADGVAPFFSSARVGGTLVWGDDIAAVDSPCGAALLAGDGDSIRAHELVEGRRQAASEPLELAGALTVLWPMSGGEGAVAVVRDAKTGVYEAFQLTVSCSR